MKEHNFTVQKIVVMQISRSFLFKLGAFLQNVLPALFELVLELYVRWMASGAQQYNVPSRTLSSLFKEYDLGIVHLLKVDVEGAEISVRCLRGYFV